MIWRQNTCVNWCPLESHPENLRHPVRYYCRCQCLGSSHMLIVRFVWQPPLCGIGCRHPVALLQEQRTQPSILAWKWKNIIIDVGVAGWRPCIRPCTRRARWTERPPKHRRKWDQMKDGTPFRYIPIGISTLVLEVWGQQRYQFALKEPTYDPVCCTFLSVSECYVWHGLLITQLRYLDRGTLPTETSPKRR